MPEVSSLELELLELKSLNAPWELVWEDIARKMLEKDKEIVDTKTEKLLE